MLPILTAIAGISDESKAVIFAAQYNIHLFMPLWNIIFVTIQSTCFCSLLAGSIMVHGHELPSMRDQEMKRPHFRVQ